jgi:ferritin-like protein
VLPAAPGGEERETRTDEPLMSDPDILHEAAENLGQDTRDLHRALRSLMEELEAVDWYSQRADAAGDAELKAVLAHNRDEEKEHAAMVLEWLRRRDAVLDGFLRRYLFTDAPIVGIEAEAEAQARKDGEIDPGAGGLGIGNLREASGRS